MKGHTTGTSPLLRWIAALSCAMWAWGMSTPTAEATPRKGRKHASKRRRAKRRRRSKGRSRKRKSAASRRGATALRRPLPGARHRRSKAGSDAHKRRRARHEHDRAHHSQKRRPHPAGRRKTLGKWGGDSKPKTAAQIALVKPKPKKKPKPRCESVAVVVQRAWGESRRVKLTDCKGRPLPKARAAISVLMRPHSVERPKTLPPFPAKDRSRHEWVTGIKPVHPGLVRRLQQLALRFKGKTLVVVSGYRPTSFGSLHREGEAMDMRVLGVPNEQLVQACRQLPDTGCGYYPNSVFVHVDVRRPKTGHVYWIDVSRPGQRPNYVRRYPLPSAAEARKLNAQHRLWPQRKKKPAVCKVEKSVKPIASKQGAHEHKHQHQQPTATKKPSPQPAATSPKPPAAKVAQQVAQRSGNKPASPAEAKQKPAKAPPKAKANAKPRKRKTRHAKAARRRSKHSKRRGHARRHARRRKARAHGHRRRRKH